ncbi:MAG: 4Fe-4S dicluster domain-containing protein [Coprothermobacter proteolyticus]
MPKILKVKNMNKCIGCFECMIGCASLNFHSHTLTKSAIRVKTKGGLQSQFAAVICVGCSDPACAEACPTQALTPRPGGGVLFNAKKCIGCEKCVPACIVGAIAMDKQAKKPIICKQCGACVQLCPHECLAMEEA